MKDLFKLFLLSTLFGSSMLAWGVNEVDYLDSIIEHHKESIERMKSLTDKVINNEIKELNADIIKTEKKRIKTNLKIKNKAFL